MTTTATTTTATESEADLEIATKLEKRKNIFLKMLGAVVRPIRHPTNNQRMAQLGRGIHTRQRLIRRKHTQTTNKIDDKQLIEHETSGSQVEALENPSANMDNFQTELMLEKEQSVRLARLIGGIDLTSETGSVTDDDNELESMNARTSLLTVLGPISPILLQQRFEELELAYRRSQNQLIVKAKLIRELKKEMAQMQSKYNRLFDEYCNEQRRFEDICKRYLRLQQIKREEVNKLKAALGQACKCVVSAQNALNLNQCNEIQHGREFKQNLQSFITSLQLC